jgi:hypothetical protein
VAGNSKMTARYPYNATRQLYQWLNRRSQLESFGWKAFHERLPAWRLPSPRIRPFVRTFSLAKANPAVKIRHLKRA